MRFSKYLAKTFLVFAASGAGSMFGVGVMTVATIAVSQKVLGLKASVEKQETGIRSVMTEDELKAAKVVTPEDTE